MRRTKSGESAAVKAFRGKIDSIRDGELPELEKLNREAEELLAAHKSEPPEAAEEPEDPDHEPDHAT